MNKEELAMQEREDIQSKLAPIVQEYGIEKVYAALMFCLLKDNE